MGNQAGKQQILLLGKQTHLVDSAHLQINLVLPLLLVLQEPQLPLQEVFHLVMLLRAILLVLRLLPPVDLVVLELEIPSILLLLELMQTNQASLLLGLAHPLRLLRLPQVDLELFPVLPALKAPLQVLV